MSTYKLYALYLHMFLLTLQIKRECNMKKIILSSLFALACSSFSLVSFADDYVMDVKGAHTFVQFRVKHLGYSWLYGRFDNIDGEFSYDPKDDSKNKVMMNVDVTSLNSSHAERDKHLGAEKYLNSGKFKDATFVSTSYKTTGENKAELKGDLTILGVTKPVTFDVDVIGGGSDPWGGYRQGFEAVTEFDSADFGLKSAAKVGVVELIVSVEGCKKPNDYCGTGLSK